MNMRRLLPLLLVITLVSCSYRDHLNQFLHEFEEVAKDNVVVEHVGDLNVLSAMKLTVRINLQNKVFHAVLQPHTRLFHPDLVVKHQESHGPVKGSINIAEHLEGVLLDEPGSRVLLHIKDNVLTGTIKTADNVKYFIEPSHRHVKEPHDFHMIAYRLSDVKFNFTHDNDKGHFCGHESHDSNKQGSDKDYSFVLPEGDSGRFEEDKNTESGGFEYSRKKRDDEKKDKCPLALIGHYSFYDQVNGANEANTINYMIGLVQEIDALYTDQSMDSEESDYYKDFGFNIKHIEVIKSKDITTDTASYLYYDDSFTPGVSDLLKNLAYGDWGDYCLAHLFTNYDYAGGILGLAYTASYNQYGGICPTEYNEKGNDPMHLNVGITTSVNFGRSLLTSELVFITGHEFGHNWGSSHDSDVYAECAPSGNRYMMYPAAVDGSQDNNEKFSPCSKAAINAVLVWKSDRCFVGSSDPMCGNSVTEDGEECDPGYNDTDCCVDCQFVNGAVCEDSSEECCTDCQYTAADEVCLSTNYEDDTSHYCVMDYVCAGDSATCNPGGNVQDDTVCYDNGRCNSGVCTGMCEHNGLFSCMCSDDSEICFQCCKNATDGLCELYDSGEQLADGKLCGNGICVEGLCEISAQDVQEKFSELMDAMDVNMLLRWFRNNIVFTIIVFTSIFWIPLSIFVDWLDDKYDLGALDDVLGSSNNEMKRDKVTAVPSNASGMTLMMQNRGAIAGEKNQAIISPRLPGSAV